MNDELKPCPMCGEAEKLLIETPSEFADAYVYCFTCGCKGPLRLDTYVEAWNTRAEQEQWISVDDRWPAEVTGNIVLGHNGSYAFECEFDDGFWCNLGGDEMTHWMPLPKPPTQ